MSIASHNSANPPFAIAPSYTTALPMEITTQIFHYILNRPQVEASFSLVCKDWYCAKVIFHIEREQCILFNARPSIQKIKGELTVDEVNILEGRISSTQMALKKLHGAPFSMRSVQLLKESTKTDLINCLLELFQLRTEQIKVEKIQIQQSMTIRRRQKPFPLDKVCKVFFVDFINVVEEVFGRSKSQVNDMIANCSKLEARFHGILGRELTAVEKSSHFKTSLGMLECRFQSSCMEGDSMIALSTENFVHWDRVSFYMLTELEKIPLYKERAKKALRNLCASPNLTAKQYIDLAMRNYLSVDQCLAFYEKGLFSAYQKKRIIKNHLTQ